MLFYIDLRAIWQEVLVLRKAIAKLDLKMGVDGLSHWPMVAWWMIHDFVFSEALNTHLLKPNHDTFKIN